MPGHDGRSPCKSNGGRAQNAVDAVGLSSDGKLLAIGRQGELELRLFPRRLADARKSSDVHFGQHVNGVGSPSDGRSLPGGGRIGVIGEHGLRGVSGWLAGQRISGHTRACIRPGLVPMEDAGPICWPRQRDQAVERGRWERSCGRSEGHNGAVFELAFRPDGKVLARASGDRTVKLWNVATGERLDTLKESQKELYSLAFSPDGDVWPRRASITGFACGEITPRCQGGDEFAAIRDLPMNRPFLRLVWSADGRTAGAAPAKIGW